jgi:hypothetical protein
VGDELVVVRPDRTVDVVSGAAAQLLPLCDGQTSIAELVDDVAAVFGLPHESAQISVQEALDPCVRSGLLSELGQDRFDDGPGGKRPAPTGEPEYLATPADP